MKTKILCLVIFLVLFAQTISSAQTYQVIADGVTYDSFNAHVFILTDSVNDNYKIIRNCTFSNGSISAIWLSNVHNIIIENCTFENISAVTNSSEQVCLKVTDNSDSIFIRNCTFKNAGCDGIQLWGLPKYVEIRDNEFWVESGVAAENGIDVKGTLGPILIINNNNSSVSFNINI